MDEVNAPNRIQPQGSVCSDSNGEESSAHEATPAPLTPPVPIETATSVRLCLVGKLTEDQVVLSAAESFNVPIITSKNGHEFTTTHDRNHGSSSNNDYCTIFVIDSFEDDVFHDLYKSKQPILGPLALRQLAAKGEQLPDNTRPLFNLSMTGVVVCFTGFRNKEDLASLVPLIHHMGGSIRKTMSGKVTHLISNICTGEKYQYATVFRLPTMSLQWVYASWERRHDIDFSATQDVFVAQYKLKPFHGAKVCFVGFPEEEEKHMTEILQSNGGTLCNLDDPVCTHIVMERAEVYNTLEAAAAAAPLSSPHPPLLLTTAESPSLSSLIPPLNISSTTTVASNQNEQNFNYTNFLETLHEKSRECLQDTLTNFDLVNDASFDNNSTTNQIMVSPSCLAATTVKRKRKSSSADRAQKKKKCAEDKKLCSSEKKPSRRISGIFKTPLNYFSSRRRTIDSGTLSGHHNQSLNLNQSIVSSSGIFSVDNIENLNICDTSNSSVATPQSSKKTSKRGLFSRTFSSSKFSSKSGNNSKSKKLMNTSNLNATRLSFADDDSPDSVAKSAAEKLNFSCFPNISCNIHNANPASSSNNNQSELPLRANEFPPRDRRRAGPCAVVAVVDASVTEKPDSSARTHIVKAEWFWTSVQKEICLEEKDYLYDDYVEAATFSPGGGRRESQLSGVPGGGGGGTPGSASGGSRRKRKRLETLLSLAHHPSHHHHHQVASPSLLLHHNNKRRSSVSDAGLLSVSGSFLDCTASPDGKASLVDGQEPGGAAGAAAGGGGGASGDTPRKGLTARQQIILELVQTESNYVDILHTIMTMFKEHLEKMPEEEALLNNTELNLIFGKVPPIYETHVKMLEEMRPACSHWSDNLSIGNIIVKYSKDLLKAYPPYINYFEEMKEMLLQCDQNKPRFHAFLKACQTKPECGRQSLQELMIRPVQRLGSICLLLASILKNTPKSNPDHAALEQALAALKRVLDSINEDKRKAEAQVTIFTIFNDIDNCPPDIVSSHRHFIAKADVIQVTTTEGLSSSKGNYLVLFLFSDQIELCKQKKSSKSSSYTNAKSPANSMMTLTASSSGGGPGGSSSSSIGGGLGGAGPGTAGTLTSAGCGPGGSSNSLQRHHAHKPYKHVKLLPLNTIKRVIDIKETEQCQKVFCLVTRAAEDGGTGGGGGSGGGGVMKERMYTFAMADEEADKTAFLRILTRQMANNACTPDADKFLAYLESHQLDIDTSDVVNNGTLSKAFKFATKTKLKVGRAFSFNKTPNKLKRAVSSMMSPFGSSNNLTPASELAQMRLASYNNINELGNAENNASESPLPPPAPMSVQPTRKMKAASLSMMMNNNSSNNNNAASSAAALKRL